MKMRKSLIVVLSFILLLAVLAGCSNNKKSETKDNDYTTKESSDNFNAEGYPIVKEPITLTMFGAKAPTHTDWDNMSLFKERKKKTNIDFKFKTPPFSGLEQQKKLVMAGGDYPDILMKAQISPLEEVEYGTSGAFIPLQKLIEKYAPNLQKLLKAHPDVKPSLTAPDGNIYSLPWISEAPRPQMVNTWINGKWLNNLEITELPQTTEEFYELLKKFKKQDANGNGKDDEVPLSVAAPAIPNLNRILLPAFGIVEDENNAQGVYADDNKKVHYAFIQDQYKQFLKYMNRLWKENLLDHGIFTQKNDQYFAKGSDGRIGVFPGASPFGALRSQSDEELKQAKALPPLTSPVNDKKMIFGNIPISRGVFVITKNNKHPEASIRWADFFYSKEGSRMAHLGVEGKQWKWTKEDKSQYKLIVSEGKNDAKVRGQGSPEVGPAHMPEWIRSEFVAKKDPEGLSAWSDRKAKPLLKYAKTSYPLVHLKKDEQKQVSSIRNNIDSYYEQTAAKFITGDMSFDQWDKYVSTVKSMGVDKMVKIYQDAYDRYQKAAK